MNRSTLSRLCLIAWLPMLGSWNSVQAADGADESRMAACDGFAANPFDPRNDTGKGVEDRNVPILDGYFACKAVVDEGDLSPRVVYQFGRAALAAGDMRTAQQAAQAGIQQGYPASAGIYVRLFLRSLDRAINQADAVQELVDGAVSGGYPHVHFDKGLGLEQLAVLVAAKPKALLGDAYDQLLKGMTEAYGEAARTTESAQAWYRYARAQFIHRQQFGEGPDNASAEDSLSKAVNGGSPAAAFYEEMRKAIAAGKSDEASLRPGLRLWQAALEDGVREAVFAGLQHAVMEKWAEMLKDPKLKDEAKEVFRNALMLVENTILIDPVLSAWMALAKELPQEKWGVDRLAILERGLGQGILPAARILIEDESLELPEQIRDNILLAAAMNADSRYAPWIRDTIQRSYLLPDEVESGRLRVGFEVANTLSTRGVDAALIDAGLIARRLGNQQVFEQAVDGFFQRLNERQEDVSDSRHDRNRRWKVFDLFTAIYDGGAGEVMPEVHPKGLTQMGSIYVNAVMDFYKDRSYQAFKDSDVALLEDIYEHAASLAKSDRKAAERFQDYVGKKVPGWLHDIKMRDKPVCEEYKADYGNYWIKATAADFQVNRYKGGGYEYRESALGDGATGHDFLMFINAPDDGDANVHGVDSHEYWMRENGRFNIGYDSVFGLYGWHMTLAGNAARGARDRAMQGGDTTLRYKLGNGESRQTTYDFTGFGYAYEEARGKHREIKRVFDALECRIATGGFLPF